MFNIIVNVVLFSILLAYVIGNNIAILRDPSRYVGISNKYLIDLIIILSIYCGLLIEGLKMHSIKHYVYSDVTLNIIILAVLIHAIFFTKYGIPYSVTQGIIGGIVGASLYTNYQINLSYIYLVVIIWILYPFINLALSYGISLLIRKRRRVILHLTHLIGILGPFILGYVYGANTVGTITSLSLIDIHWLFIVVLIIVPISTLFIGKAIGETLSGRIYGLHPSAYISSIISTTILIELATQLSIPVPFSSLLTLGYIGPIFTYKTHMFRKMDIIKIFIFWVLNPLSTLFLVYILYFLIYPFPY